MEFPKTDEITTNSVFVSFFGSLLGLRAWPGTNRVEKFFNLLLGFVMAIVAGPALADYTNVVSEHTRAAITFFSGAFGLLVFAAVVEGIKQVPVVDLIKLRIIKALDAWAEQRKKGQEP